MKIFDTHAHYSDPIYDVDRDELYKKMFTDGVSDIVLIGANLKNSKEERDLAIKYNHKENMPNFYYTIGVHPDDIPKFRPSSEDGIKYLNELKSLASCDVNNNSAIAIGEIGLDYYGDFKNDEDYKLQKEWFIAQIELAKKMDLPIVVHSRDACKDTLDIIKTYIKGLTGIIHCFSYEKDIALEYAKMGFLIGVGGVVTFKNGRKLKDVVSALSIENIVTETDAPWLSPAPFRGKRNDSSYIKYVIEEIANIKGIDINITSEVLYNNALEIYGL